MGCLRFDGPTLEVMPLNLAEFFANLNALIWINSGLKEITTEHLKGFTKLVNLDLSGNGIFTLGVNLFQYSANLHSINFDGNKITYIDDYLVDNLKTLEIFSIKGNPCISFDAPLPEGRAELLRLIKACSTLTTTTTEGPTTFEPDNFPSTCATHVNWFKQLIQDLIETNQYLQDRVNNCNAGVVCEPCRSSGSSEG